MNHFIGYDVVEPFGLQEIIQIGNVITVDINEEIVITSLTAQGIKEHRFKKEDFVKIEII